MTTSVTVPTGTGIVDYTVDGDIYAVSAGVISVPDAKVIRVLQAIPGATAPGFASPGVLPQASIVSVSGGPPTSGYYPVGAMAFDALYGVAYRCTVAGSPGTWAIVGPGVRQTSKTTSPSAAIGSTIATIATLAPVTVVAGVLPVRAKLYVNSVVASLSGGVCILVIFDEGGHSWTRAFTARANGDTQPLEVDLEETYAPGTSKTFTAYGRCTTAGTATFGTATGDTCAYLSAGS